MEATGYSGTPLAKKLGFETGQKVRLVNEPIYYFDLFSQFSDGVDFETSRDNRKSVIHYFAKDIEELTADITGLKDEITQDGSIWISWPKKSSKVETNITENLIRNLALSNGLVDVKVCAIDAVWSGLKLVIPVKQRV